MDSKLIVSVLAAVAIYIMIAAVFGVGIKMIAKQVPAGHTDPQFAPVVCSLAVACLHPERLQSMGSFEKSGLQTVPEEK